MMRRILDAKQFSIIVILLLFSYVAGLKRLYHPNPNILVGRRKDDGLYDRSYIGCRQYLGYGDNNDVEYHNHSKDESADLLTSKRVYDQNCLRWDRGDIMKLYASKNEVSSETAKGKSHDNTANRNQLKDGHLYVPQGMHQRLSWINVHITLLSASAIHIEYKCRRWCDGQGKGCRGREREINGVIRKDIICKS